MQKTAINISFILSLSYVFAEISQVLQLSHFLEGLPFELALSCGSLLFCGYYLLNSDNFLSTSDLFFIGALVFLTTWPLAVTVLKSQINILSHPDYKTYVKILMILPGLYFYSGKYKETFMLLIVFVATVTLSVHFFYRFFALNEVRAFDGRPLLDLRYGDPNFLGVVFALGIPIGLRLFFGFKGVFKYLTGISILLIAYSLILTQSRMGVLSAFAGTGYIIFSQRSFSIRYLLAFAVIAVAFILWSPGLLERLINIADRSNSLRVRSWENALILFYHNPLLGVGWEESVNYFYSNTGYPLFRDKFSKLTVHNVWLKNLAELGIIGAVGYFLVFATNFKKTLTSSYVYKYYFIGIYIVLLMNSLTLGIGQKGIFILYLFVPVVIQPPLRTAYD